MRSLPRLALIALLIAACSGPALADSPAWPIPEASWAEADWQAFGENLVVGIASDNDGVRASALQMIIRYGDNLDVDEAVFDIARIYRDHNDERMRHLAAVSCLHLKSRWAVSYLRMSEPFEKSERIKHTIRAVLAEMDARAQSKGTVETGKLLILAKDTAR